jgi:hypothetical protein
MTLRDLSKKEKLLLQLMGRQPYSTNEELSKIIGFKYAEYVSTLQKKLQKKEYFAGPLMFPDFGKIFKNKVTRIHAFIMFDKPYDYVRSLLQEIDCWISFYPLEEGIFCKYLVGFINSDTQKLRKIFEYLRDEEAIQYYHLFEQKCNWEVINPTFIIDDSDTPSEPNFDHLLDETSIPDMEYGSFIDISLNKVAQMLIEHLWIGQGGCDLKKIVRLRKKYMAEKRNTLKEMLRTEKGKEAKKMLRTELRKLKGDLLLNEFREAYHLLVDHDVLQKIYYIYPFPHSKCANFWLMIKCKSLEATKHALFNYGKNVRIFTRVTIVQSVETGEWYGTIMAVGNPFLGQKLMTALDRYPEIEDRKLFPVRSYPASYWAGQAITIDGYYSPETQTLDYPYDLFYERVKQKREEDGQRREARALV